MLRATTACNFSSLIWPASSATRRFSKPTFRLSGATHHWKNTVFRDFPTFSRICIFLSSYSSSSDLLSSNLPLLSASALLCFSSVHIVGSLTSKLPSIMLYLAMKTYAKQFQSKAVEMVKCFNLLQWFCSTSKKT